MSERDLEDWARIERHFLREVIDLFKGGAKLISPTGDDISVQQRRAPPRRRKRSRGHDRQDRDWRD